MTDEKLNKNSLFDKSLLLKKFANHLIAISVSLSTVKNYVSDVNHFLDWRELNYQQQSRYINSIDSASFNKAQCIKYKKHLVDSQTPIKSANRKLSSLRKFSQFLKEWSYATDDITEGVSNISRIASPANPPLIIEYAKFLTGTKVSKITIKNYISDIRHYLHYVAKSEKSLDSLDSISEMPDLSSKFLSDISLNTSTSTLKRKTISVRRFINWAKNNAYIKGDLQGKDVLSTDVFSNDVLSHQWPKFTGEDITWTENVIGAETTKPTTHVQEVAPDALLQRNFEYPNLGKRQSIMGILFFVVLILMSIVTGTNNVLDISPIADTNSSEILVEKSNYENLKTGIDDSNTISTKTLDSQKNYNATLASVENILLEKKTLEGGEPLENYFEVSSTPQTVLLTSGEINSDDIYYLYSLATDESTTTEKLKEFGFTAKNLEEQKAFLFGEGSITKENDEVLIKNDAITKSHLIYLTPTSPMANSTLYVSETGEGFFKVRLTGLEEFDVTFNWWGGKYH